ncbi:hypothetical protein [Pseudobutyrivibrio sp.]|uniref:hypothetical protein n=1 Tax=Pseudobutyrivibrio sp. TaxID=2014367 RepID=UPI0038688A56
MALTIEVSAQTDPSFYLNEAINKLEKGDCQSAQKLYSVYKDISGQHISYIETLIKKCKKPQKSISETSGDYYDGERPYILLSGIFGFNTSKNPQLSWGVECDLIWGDIFQGGLIFKFRTSFGYTSQKYVPGNNNIRKNYYNGTIGAILGTEYIYVGISMGYAYRTFTYTVNGSSVETESTPMKGFAGDLGVYVTLTHGIYLSISVGTICFKYAECVIGLGYRF